MIEGKGKVPPAPIRFAIADRDILATVSGAKAISHFANRKDPWGGGLIGSMPSALREVIELEPHERPIVAGKLGEYAVIQLARDKFGGRVPPVDFQKRAYGDGGIDANIVGVKLQIKTRVTSATNLVKAFNEDGRRLEILGHAHVFCSWDCSCFIHVLGWLPNRDLVHMPVEPSRRGNWKNYIVRDFELLPLCRLWCEIELRLN